tara:strand:- start:2152 stop:2319 length:168 start_codon:yes stop_codon:yes gene_type:complete
LTKNLAADLSLQGLSADELQRVLETELDTIEEKLIALPTRYSEPPSISHQSNDQA